MTSTPRLSLDSVNALLASTGHSERLARGRGGYFYFYGGNTACWPQTSVMVFRLNDLSLAGWWAEFTALRDAALLAGRGPRVPDAGPLRLNLRG